VASVVTPKDNPRHRWIQVFVDGKRKTIRLGVSNNRAAEKHKQVIETLLACKTAKLALAPDVAEFIGALPDDIRARYERAGLIGAKAVEPEVPKNLLGPFLKNYFESRALDVKKSSQVVFSHTHKRLIEYFGVDREIESITAADARAFRKWLAGTNKRDKATGKTGLSINTVKRRTGFCKQAFAQAVTDGIIDRNPFEGLPASVTSNKDRAFYVDLETFNKVLAKAPNARWKALLALARLGAFRIPSEAEGLKWEHVLWEAKRIRVVDSSKTEQHAKRAIRIVPMVPAIERELLAWFAESTEGAERVFPDIDGDTNLRTQLEKILKRAGVTQWPKLWQNLRASGSTDFARTLPSHVAAAICGHTEQVAKEHYWQVTDSDMTDALEKMRDTGAAKSAAVDVGTAQNGSATENDPPTNTLGTNEIASAISIIVDDIGLEPTTPTMSTWCSNQLS
jgi:integrase